MALAALIYGGWAAVTYWHARLPWPLVAAIGAWLVAWQSSLQHELLHGHPTRHARLNWAIATPPLSLWLPFELYRSSHLLHHRDERLTDPLDDPESFYWTPSLWQDLSWIGRQLVIAQQRLAGRMLIGPAWNIGRFFYFEAQTVSRGDRVRARMWLRHVLHVVPVVAWLSLICGMSLLFYVVAIVLPAMALLKLRSFAEHRAAASVPERTAIVENSCIFGPLFLFNNLHAAHHERPGLAWYRIPAWYRANRDRLVAENGGLVYDTYWDVARRYFFRRHDHTLHPKWKQPGVAADVQVAS